MPLRIPTRLAAIRTYGALSGTTATPAEPEKPNPIDLLSLPAGKPAPPKFIDPKKPVATNEVMVGNYNVENLFGTTKEEGKDYDQFTPDGAYNWTEPKLAKKLSNLGRVIRQVNGGKGPDILALTEVQSKAVLQRLNNEALADLGYEAVVHIEGDDWRGIDNAILSRYPLIGEPKHHKVHDKDDPLWGKDTTREILEATFDVKGVPLTVVVAHMPRNLDWSKRKKQRMAVATALRNLVDNLQKADDKREIMILGDFNSNPGQPELANGLAATANPVDVKKNKATMYNTIACLADQVACAKTGKRVERLDQIDAVLELDDGKLGTNLWEEKWWALDHVLVSKGLLDNEGLSWVPGSTQVLREPWMLREDGGPKAFYEPKVEPKDQKLDKSGFSDHLPVVTRLRIHE